MTKDVPNLTVNVTLEDDDFEILKQKNFKKRIYNINLFKTERSLL